MNVGNWQVKDDLAFQRGRHSYQLGVEYRQHYNFFALQERSSFDFLALPGRHLFSWPDRYTRDSFADFLLGYPARTSLGGEGRRGSFHQNSIYSYFQDISRLWEAISASQLDQIPRRWRILPTLTLTLGIRYELRFPWRDKRGFMGNFDPVEEICSLRSVSLRFSTCEPPALRGPLPGTLSCSAAFGFAPGESGRFEPGFPLIEWRPWDGLLPRMGLALRLGRSSVLHRTLWIEALSQTSLY